MWQPPQNVKRVLTGRTGKGRSLEAPIINALITTPSMLAIMCTNMFYSAIKAVKGVWGLVPRKTFQTAFPTMLEIAPSQVSSN